MDIADGIYSHIFCTCRREMKCLGYDIEDGNNYLACNCGYISYSGSEI